MNISDEILNQIHNIMRQSRCEREDVYVLIGYRAFDDLCHNAFYDLRVSPDGYYSIRGVQLLVCEHIEGFQVVLKPNAIRRAQTAMLCGVWDMCEPTHSQFTFRKPERAVPMAQKIVKPTTLDNVEW